MAGCSNRCWSSDSPSGSQVASNGIAYRRQYGIGVTVRTQLLASYSNAVTGQPKLEGKIVNSLTLQLQHEDAGLGVCTKHSMHIAFGLSAVCFGVCAAENTLERTCQRASFFLRLSRVL
jgi:hypothetical protein